MAIKKKLYVMIGCDCDHDRLLFNKRMKKNEITWDGYMLLGNNFRQLRKKIYQTSGLFPRLTINIRADKHVKHYLKSYNYLFEVYFKKLYKGFHADDEIAWHHHLYDRIDDVWVRNNHEGFITEEIFNTYASIKKYGVSTLHTGWCYQNTISMNAYNDVGIRIDYSCLPGMFRNHKTGYNYFHVEENTVYIPNRSDYQDCEDKSIQIKDNQNTILEIPTNTVNLTLSKYLYLFHEIRKIHFPINESKVIRKGFFQINSHPILFKYFLDRLFLQNPSLDFYSTYFHADELLPNNFKTPLALGFYNRNNLFTNIIYLIKKSAEHNRDIAFVTFTDFKRILENNVL